MSGTTLIATPRRSGIDDLGPCGCTVCRDACAVAILADPTDRPAPVAAARRWQDSLDASDPARTERAEAAIMTATVNPMWACIRTRPRTRCRSRLKSWSPRRSILSRAAPRRNPASRMGSRAGSACRSARSPRQRGPDDPPVRAGKIAPSVAARLTLANLAPSRRRAAVLERRAVGLEPLERHPPPGLGDRTDAAPLARFRVREHQDCCGAGPRAIAKRSRG